MRPVVLLRGVLMNATFAHSRAAGVTSFARAEVAAVLASRVGMRWHHLGVDNIMFAAMTVQQAKNREFDGVVVLLPSKSAGTPNISGDCFYNAITRARRWCMVIVQSEEPLKAPPFA